MVKMVNFMLYIFYHNFFKRFESIREKKIYILFTVTIHKAPWNKHNQTFTGLWRKP